jgi:hypothetical protein
MPGGMDESLVLPLSGGQALTVFVDGAAVDQKGSFTLAGVFTPSNEVEPNDAFGQANPLASPFVGTVLPMGDQDFVAVMVPGPSSTIKAETFDFNGSDCQNYLLDSEVEILGTDGATSLTLNDDKSMSDGCSLATVSGLGAGKYFVRVAASMMFSPMQTFGYELVVTVN